MAPREHQIALASPHLESCQEVYIMIINLRKQILDMMENRHNIPHFLDHCDTIMTMIEKFYDHRQKYVHSCENELYNEYVDYCAQTCSFINREVSILLTCPHVITKLQCHETVVKILIMNGTLDNTIETYVDFVNYNN